ncbi:hypothetical protein [Blastococcus sp. SYSU D00813]
MADEIGRALGALYDALRGPRRDEAHPCMYGTRPGNEDSCNVLVPAGAGWRELGLVFCSEEHAALDQEEQAL